jgi:hypothetical protein
MRAAARAGAEGRQAGAGIFTAQIDDHHTPSGWRKLARVQFHKATNSLTGPFLAFPPRLHIE